MVERSQQSERFHVGQHVGWWGVEARMIFAVHRFWVVLRRVA